MQEHSRCAAINGARYYVYTTNGRFTMYHNRNMDHYWCVLAASGALAFVASIIAAPLWP
jgi:hypothetical protein